ncbi:serine hydrolase domain-containing protein [Pseudomonadota bacterium]
MSLIKKIAPGLSAARVTSIGLLLLMGTGALKAEEPGYDYFSANREMIRNGVQAVLTCNGLFTSNRTLEQVFAQELAYMVRFGGRVGTAQGGAYTVDRTNRAVGVGEPGQGPVMTAAFREGIGCVIMAPGEGVEDIASLPVIERPSPAVNPATIPWPNGDLLDDEPLSSRVNPAALQAASDWAFERESSEQDTLSLLVIHQGNIILERYAEGVDMHTRTRTWSTAKSIAVTLVGMLVEQGKLSLDEPMGLEWLPAVAADESDPRDDITLRHVLNMSSGLYPVDSFGMEYATGSGLSYWAGASSVEGAMRRGMIREPGAFWDYENYDTLLAVYAMKKALGDEDAYQRFPRNALLNRIGMHNTLVSTDRFGDFIFSSQVYTNARDLARFGLLYLNDGVWDGERLISEDWIEFVRTPAPATAETGNFYGGQWWLVPDDRKDVPKDAYYTAGNRGQYVIVVPSHDVVIVRRGLDFGKQGFDPLDLTREVLKAISP